MVASSPDWRAPMAGYLDDHLPYLCDPEGLGAREGVEDVLEDVDLACTPQTTSQ